MMKRKRLYENIYIENNYTNTSYQVEQEEYSFFNNKL
jgi:hypothetical protein